MAIRFLTMSFSDLLSELPKMMKENPLFSVQQRTTRPIGPFSSELETMPEAYVYRHKSKDTLMVEANVNAMPEFSVGNHLVPLDTNPDREPQEYEDIVQRFEDGERKDARSALWIARAFVQRGRTYVKILRHYAATSPA